jgi:hypothetical protein
MRNRIWKIQRPYTVGTCRLLKCRVVNCDSNYSFMLAHLPLWQGRGIEVGGYEETCSTGSILTTYKKQIILASSAIYISFQMILIKDHRTLPDFKLNSIPYPEHRGDERDVLSSLLKSFKAVVTKRQREGGDSFLCKYSVVFSLFEDRITFRF